MDSKNIYLFADIFLGRGCGGVWWKRERGRRLRPQQTPHECVRPGRRGKGRTLPEMKVGRNKGFGFNLVGKKKERRFSPCASLLKASRSVCAQKTATKKAQCAKDCDRKDLCVKSCADPQTTIFQQLLFHLSFFLSV